MTGSPAIAVGGDDAVHRGVADPSTDIRAGVIAALLFFVLFLGWAAFARLDAAAYAPGSVVVGGNRQAVQHREGGVVGAVLVRDGQRVTQGQLLIRLAAADVDAQERALASQAIRLLARRAMLEAEQLGRTEIEAPREFARLQQADDRTEAALALDLQRAEFRARRSVLSTRGSALDQRAAQSRASRTGYARQRAATQAQLQLIERELEALAPLANKGFVSQTRLRELERARAALIGQMGEYDAGVIRSDESAGESATDIVTARNSFRERSAAELRETGVALGDIVPRWKAARDQVERSEIRAPATGIVVGLSVFTKGGVIQAGQQLMEIVPQSADLVIHAQLAPEDVDDVKPGQTARVKFVGLHERELPDLQGTLSQVSADALTEERSGRNYFAAEVRLSAGELRRLQSVRGATFALRPGMPVQILIPLRKRTALEYALEPLVGSFWGAFREH